MKKKIYIDAGHGGDSVGAVYKGRMEQDDTLRLALAVGKLLSAQENILVKYSRTASVNPTIAQRCSEANSWGADYFISIHRNAFMPEKANGADVFVYSKVAVNGETYLKAKGILDSLCVRSGFKERAIHLGAPSYTDFGVNRLTKMSSCLLEVGFIDSTVDNDIFDSRFEDVALGIAEGLCRAVGETFKPLGKEPLPGDMNEDGKITAEDARLALRYAVGLESAKENALALGDLDGDGKLSAADARLILRRAVGLE